MMMQVSVLGACLGEPSQACLIMELVEGGSLAARIHDRKKRRLTYLQILQVSHQKGTESNVLPCSQSRTCPMWGTGRVGSEACCACRNDVTMHCCLSPA